MLAKPGRYEVEFLRFACLAVALLVGVFGLPTPFLGHAAGQSPYSPPPAVQFAWGYYNVNESDGTAVITVNLSNTISDVVTVDYATSDGTAIAGRDYTAATGTITFPGVSSQTVSVAIIDNGNYTNQIAYFTITLSNPSPNATLGMLSTTCVYILNADPAPTATIVILGTPEAQKVTPGGFVCVNANNDNKSKLTYADGKEVPTGAYGIPQMRDYDPANINLATADRDLVQIFFTTNNFTVNGPENIVLSMTTVTGARAKIQVWDTQKKNNIVTLPTNWTVPVTPPKGASMPDSVCVEGLLESADLGEITLQLQILNKGAVVSTDTCTLTVTPVLSDFKVEVAPGAVPNYNYEALTGIWWIQSSTLPMGKPAFTMSMSARWDKVRGNPRIIQTESHVNNLMPGNLGADTGSRKFDFAAGGTLVDCLELVDIPFERVDETQIPAFVLSGEVKYSVIDSPRLPLSDGIKAQFVNSVLPPVGGTTNVDTTDKYQIYATVAFTDKSLYCFGREPWNVRFAGAVTQPVANAPAATRYSFTPADGNGNTGSGAFVPGDRTNDNPAATGPTTANTGGNGWR